MNGIGMAGCLLLLLLAVASGCTRAAYTGRFQSTYQTDDEEVALADQAVASYRKSVRLAAQPAMNERVDRIVRALVDAAKAGPAGDRARQLVWNVSVIESPDTSVASFPNGTLFVTAALVRALPTDDALAGALGHAVAGVLLRHSDEVAGRRSTNRTLGLMGSGTSFGSSRIELGEEHEEEADWVGLVLAVDAGYDPDGAVAWLDRLGLKDRGERARKRLPDLRARKV